MLHNNVVRHGMLVDDPKASQTRCKEQSGSKICLKIRLEAFNVNWQVVVQDYLNGVYKRDLVNMVKRALSVMDLSVITRKIDRTELFVMRIFLLLLKFRYSCNTLTSKGLLRKK